MGLNNWSTLDWDRALNLVGRVSNVAGQSSRASIISVGSYEIGSFQQLVELMVLFAHAGFHMLIAIVIWEWF